MVLLLQVHNHGKIWKNGKGWYFQFDDDNEISYKYILSITETWMASLIYTIPHIAKKIKKITEITNTILDMLSTEYRPTQQAFTHAYWNFHHVCSLQNLSKFAWLW